MCFGTHASHYFSQEKKWRQSEAASKNAFGIENKTGVAFNNLKRRDSAHCKVSYSLSQVFTALLAMCSAHSQQHFVQPGSCHARNLVIFKYAKSLLVHGTLRQSLAICAWHAFYVCSGNSSSQKRLEDKDATFLWDQLGL